MPLGSNDLRFSRKILLVVTVVVVIAHLSIGGLQTAKRTFWMLRRYPGFGSSAERCERNELKYPELIDQVLEAVPPNDRILVQTYDQDFCCDLAFFCFPRPVFMLRPKVWEESPGSPVLERAGPDRWSVRFERRPTRD
jgi:hypothetical protein